MDKRVCCIFNLAPHYRAPIYKLMDTTLDCDFYFGDKVNTAIKIMDVEQLKGYKKTIRNKRIFGTGFLWQSGAWKLVFKPYSYFIVTGSPYIISNYVIAITARLLNKKVFAWSHGMKLYAGRKRRLLENIYFRLCHKVLLYGEYSKSFMVQQGFSEQRLIPIYNSLDYESQLKIRKYLRPSAIFSDRFSNEDPNLIYIGRLQKVKKLDLLINALKLLNDSGTKCNLILIGKDVDGIGLEDMVEEYDLQQRVWFYGPCYDEAEIGKMLFNADLCISPGPIGLTALHALTFGTPIITNDDFSRQMPEFEVIQKNVTGDFFSSGDLSDLADTIDNWLKTKGQDREQLRLEAYKIIDEKYNPNYQISVLKNLISQS